METPSAQQSLQDYVSEIQKQYAFVEELQERGEKKLP